MTDRPKGKVAVVTAAGQGIGRAIADAFVAERAIVIGTGQAGVRQGFIDRQPMGRLGKAQEVAALAVFLASDESLYVTGQPHLVDGGLAL